MKLRKNVKKPTLKKGETYVGITLHNDKPHHLILLPNVEEDKTHAEATAWAKKQGGVLPSRIDMIVLFEKAKVKSHTYDWYWTNEKVASKAYYAWVAGFGYGYQIWYRKNNDSRCRAVRRVAIPDAPKEYPGE